MAKITKTRNFITCKLHQVLSY